MLIMSADKAKALGLTPRAKIRAMAVAGCDAAIMGYGPVPATQKALKRAGMTMADIELAEFNEAFAAQALSCTRTWGLADNDPRINPNGGGIAIGHPLGMTGARLLLTAAIELQKTGKRYALVTMCIGVGQGYATIIERA
jgi:acetyl-CoA acyltransferase